MWTRKQISILLCNLLPSWFLCRRSGSADVVLSPDSCPVETIIQYIALSWKNDYFSVALNNIVFSIFGQGKNFLSICIKEKYFQSLFICLLLGKIHIYEYEVFEYTVFHSEKVFFVYALSSKFYQWIDVKTFFLTYSQPVHFVQYSQSDLPPLRPPWGEALAENWTQDGRI